MMSTKVWLAGAAKAGVLCALALVLREDAQAADSSVPVEWNVGPMRSGAYLEAFDATLPTWAGRVGANSVTNLFPSMAASALPARSNAWFDANAKVMLLETAGEVVTNALAHPGDVAVNFAADPVFVDLRMKFDPLAEAPDAAMMASVKMGLFVSADAKLVVVHGSGVYTNATALDTNKWHQVTVKLYDGNKFDVLTNDVLVVGNLTVKSVGSANVLSSANFYGTGYIDELYVGRGDPAYAVTGPTGPIPTLPGAGANPPTSEEQTLINAWLSGYVGITNTTTLNMTQDQLSMAYLLNDLNGDDTEATAPTYSFGISKIDLSSPTSLIVTLALKVDDVDKDGAINGKIQLQGKVNINDGWTTLTEAVTPVAADFTDGEATYTFSIPAGGYKFFKPLIVP